MITQHTTVVRTDASGEKLSESEHEEKLYTIQELKDLDERAYRRAYEKWAQGVLDYEWWDGVYESAVEAGEALGVTFDCKRGKNGRGEVMDTSPKIWFSGFSSQGDGASWEGRYEYKKGAAAAIKKQWPEDAELQHIAADLQELQRKNFYRLSATVSKSYRGEHSGTMDVTTFRRGEDGGERNEELTQLLRDFADWIYRMLEKESEYLQSEEQFVESVADDLFDEAGIRR